MLDATMVGIFSGDLAQAVARRRDSADHASERQRDGSMYDMRMLGGFMTSALFASDDPSTFATLNTASRIPTTLDHPNAVVQK